MMLVMLMLMLVLTMLVDVGGTISRGLTLLYSPVFSIYFVPPFLM